MPQIDIEKRREYNRLNYLKNKEKYKCEHNKRRNVCKDCNGSSICEHERVRNTCKECKGASICEHNKRRNVCKDCNGSSICEHNRQRIQCKECGGSSFCEHNRIINTCKECGGSSFCEHKRRRSTCKECGGSSICEHNRIRSSCKECGGISICEHNRIRSICKECGGSSICEHNRERKHCKECSPHLVIINLQRSNINRIMKQANIEKTKPSIEYLGCSAEYFKEYIKSKMTPDMTFDNIHLDHIKPISKFDLNDEDELLKCCHYTNFQPLISTDNLEKSNKWNIDDDNYWCENICGKEYKDLYFPLQL